MVLDDLGLVPTLRRAARERGRRAGVAVEFDSIGQEILLATPVRPFEVMFGKILPYIAVGYIQVSLILVAAHFLFHVPMVGSLALGGLSRVRHGVSLRRTRRGSSIASPDRTLSRCSS